MEEPTEIYRTRNLQVSAFIVARGTRLLRCEQTGPQQCDFLFSDPDGSIAALVETYWSGATCKAIGFYRALLDLKNTVYHTLNDGGAR
jgi:hypothetical protein